MKELIEKTLPAYGCIFFSNAQRETQNCRSNRLLPVSPVVYIYSSNSLLPYNESEGLPVRLGQSGVQLAQSGGQSGGHKENAGEWV